MSDANILVTPQAEEARAESDLLHRLRMGDAPAFEELVRRYGQPLLAVAKRFLNEDQDAHDALQDAFLSAFRSIHNFDGKSRLHTWLHRIVVNSALGKLRSKKRSRELSIDSLLPQFADDGHQSRPYQGWTDTPDARLQQSETLGLVREAIDRLPDAYRTVLLLRDIEEFETDETAKLLGVTTGVVKTRLHRARQALRTLLDPHFRRGAV